MPAQTTADPRTFAAALPPAGALLGIDLGTKSIGLAVTDWQRQVAGPGPVIRRTKQANDLLALAEFLSERSITGIVLGLPLNMDGTPGPGAQRSRAFARTLEEYFDLPILLHDERLSSEEATEAMLAAGIPRMKRRTRIDAFAALLILESALRALPALDAPPPQP
ncbi:MAG: Holliday junction resolvase RuvX [Pacificimonas sp.]|nr:Holliday junction resolvase RuvX [Pacificimonas sp.]